MEYVAYKLVFPNGVHFGKKSIEDSEFTFAADTFFSALCQEALHFDESKLQELYDMVKGDKLCFSDAFPFIGETLYIPKPVIRLEFERIGDSRVKKASKKLTYIPVNQLENYLHGTMNVIEEKDKFDKLGISYSRTSAAITGLEETQPYRIGVYQFNSGNGLYIIVGYQSNDALELMEMLLESMSYAGIGGRRNSGLGRFELFSAKLPENLLQRLKKNGEQYMTLSISLPQENELEEIMVNANYNLIKRSGFVDSQRYADDYMRKQDLFVFAAGAYVTKKYSGDVYDVSNGGTHPVYRYAKPLFLEVGI